jgi:hypothetical protein
MKITAIIGLLLSLFSLSALAEDRSIASPRYRVGDTWKYTQINMKTGQRSSTWTQTVEKIDDASVFSKIVYASGAESSSVSTLEGNSVSTPTRTVSPYFPVLSYPLTVGKTWEKSYTMTSKKGITTSGTLKAIVTAHEELVLPVGTFDTVRVEYGARYHRLDKLDVTGEITGTYWYAPAAKRIVKEEFRDYSQGTLWTHTMYQLESFSVQ